MRATDAATSEVAKMEITIAWPSVISIMITAAVSGARVTAADPIYALPPAELAARALPETDRGNSWAYAHAGRYRWDWYGSRARHARIRRTAAGRFAADVTGNPHRYVAAALPARGSDTRSVADR